MTDRRGPTNDAGYQSSDTGRQGTMDTGISGKPAGGPMPDDGKSADINGGDLLPGAQPTLDTPTIAGDAVGAAAGSALDDDGTGPDKDTENEVDNQQRPF